MVVIVMHAKLAIVRPININFKKNEQYSIACVWANWQYHGNPFYFVNDMETMRIIKFIHVIKWYSWTRKMKWIWIGSDSPYCCPECYN